MRWLRKMVIALGRWWVRQTAASLVIALGIFIGWWVRKGTGPLLLSESFSRANASAPVPSRPGPLTPRDPAVAGYLAEFASLDGPSATLLRLQADLDRGRITDFETLAKSLLSHPLRHFREEALRSVLAAWGRKDPGGTLRFLDDYGDPADSERESRPGARRWDLAQRWARQEPVAALDYFVRTRGVGGVDSDLVYSVLSESPRSQRLKLLTEKLGEARLGSLLDVSMGYEHSSEQWRALAKETRHPQLAAVYASGALIRKCSETRAKPSVQEVKAWLAELVPSASRTQIRWQSMPTEVLATLLPALSAEDLQFGMNPWALVALHSKNPEQVLGYFQQNGSSWMPAWAFCGLGERVERRPLEEWAAIVAAAVEPAQREALGRGLVSSALSRRGSGVALESLAQRLAGLGREGETAMAALLGGVGSGSVQQVPEVFAQMSPAFQAERRMEVVVDLARHGSPTAAELWLGASSEELAQPGADAVTEELAARYVRRDSEAASDWIGRLPAGFGRDRAVARMIEMTAERDPETCAQWAATIQDPISLERATHKLNTLAGRRSSSTEQ